MALFKNKQERNRERTQQIIDDAEGASYQKIRSAADTARINKRRAELDREWREWKRMNPNSTTIPKEILNKYRDIF